MHSVVDSARSSGADPVPANRLDETFVAVPIPGVQAITIADQLILLDGWSTAVVLNESGALFWESFDGETPIGEVVAELGAALRIDPEVVRSEAMAFARHVGSLGLLDGVGPPDDVELPFLVEGVLSGRDLGDVIADVTGVDLDGNDVSLATGVDGETLLVNWSPHCGYCAAIGETLAAVGPHLESKGIGFVFLATGTVDANRAVAERFGLSPRFVVLDGGVPHPLPGCGTPAAFHVDVDRRIVADPAYGSVAVPELASRLAGVSLDSAIRAGAVEVPEGTRYLLERGGACAQDAGARRDVEWAGTGVFRLGDFHVGIRADSDETLATLDDLLLGAAVDDPRAGHSFSVALPGLDGGTRSSSGGLNLFYEGGQLKVRSRSVARVLRALLWHLDEGTLDHEVPAGTVRTRATAAIIDGRAVLLQPGLYVLDRLQAFAARRGIAFADVAFPEIDLDTVELVIGEPQVAHDSGVLARWDTPMGSSSELPPVLPGRYPLLAWGVMHPADSAVTRFTRAEAAAATLSFVLDTDDAPARLGQLGDLFAQIDGFGLWYHSEAGYVDALCEALGLD